jgi:UDP-4-amino-4,6-dideoxy-N-acetyl-beta-L-altrosamine transaminase
MTVKTQLAQIPYGRQDIDEQDVRAVVEVLNSDFLTQGPAIPRFEEAVAAYVGVAHAVAVCNATAALHLACRTLGLGPGDVLWTVPNTFVASANCALYCGAQVDFVDIDPETYNLSVSELADKLYKAKLAGKLPKVVVPVDFSGQPCELEAIALLAKEFGFRVIEDASHAIGGSYKGQKIGNCSYSDITIFSFHPVKIITTGEGGMALTRDRELAEKLALLRTHGITREPSLMKKETEGAWYYEQVDLGYNYRMTDIQAALGTSQLHRIDEFVMRRRKIAARYDEAFASLPVVAPKQKPEGNSAWHLYVIQVEESSGRTRKQVFESLRAAGVLVNVHYIPVHLQPHYRVMGFGPGAFPVAEAYYSRCISLPMYASMTEEQQQYVIEQVRRAFA